MKIKPTDVQKFIDSLPNISARENRSNFIRKARFDVKPNLVARKVRGKSLDFDISTENKILQKRVKKTQEEEMEVQAAQSSTSSQYSGEGNRFKILNNEDLEIPQASSDILKEIQEKNRKGVKPEFKRITDVSNIQSQINNCEKSSTAIKKEKVPPIVIFRQEVRDTIKILRDVLKIKNFRIKRYSSNRHSILLDNMEDFVKTREILKSVAAEHYTYCPRSEKVHTLLLKGLDPETDPNEILDELKNLNLEDLTFVQVKQFETRVSKANQRKLPIFIVQLSSDSKINKVRDIKYVNYQVVRWEKIERKEILQCRRCQRFGHTASNCQMKYRCVKCANAHEPGKCSFESGNVIDKNSLLYSVQKLWTSCLL